MADQQYRERFIENRRMENELDRKEKQEALAFLDSLAYLSFSVNGISADFIKPQFVQYMKNSNQ